MLARFGPGALAGAAEAGIRNAEPRADTPHICRAQALGTRMVLREWRPVRKNALRGFATVEQPSGLTIVNIPVCVTSGNAWLPSKPVLDGEGRHVEVSGKKQYALVFRWWTGNPSDRFSAAVVALCARRTPACDGDGR